MIDARGRSCPEPVLMLRKALGSKENSYEIMVDNRVSVENVTRFAQHEGFRVTVEDREEEYLLRLDK
jgi:TusA-related sulfurtransferase